MLVISVRGMSLYILFITRPKESQGFESWLLADVKCQKRFCMLLLISYCGYLFGTILHSTLGGLRSKVSGV